MNNKRSRSSLFLLILACMSITMLATSSRSSEAAKGRVIFQTNSQTMIEGDLRCYEPDCRVTCDCNYCVCHNQDECEAFCGACWEAEPWDNCISDA